MSNFFDKFGLIHLNENPKPDESENPLLYTAEYYVAKYINNPEMEVLHSVIAQHIGIILVNFIIVKKKFRATGISESDHFSHDNMTGLYCLAYLHYKITGLDLYIHELPILRWNNRFWLHPRDVCFYTFLKLTTKGKLCTLLSLPLLIMPLIAMVVSCAQSHKVRGSLTQLKTDGKLLTWLRTSLLGMSWIKNFMLYLIKRDGFFKSWKEVSKFYFKNPDHPVTENINE